VRTRFVLWVAIAWALPPAVQAQTATSAMAPEAPHPTLENLSIVWPISGDDDLDGVVSVRFRAAGEAGFRQGLALRRVPAGENEGFSWPNAHVGSVFDLVPDTEYEIELALDDPDGGSTSAVLTVRTRPEPAMPADARVIEVSPSTFEEAASDAAPGDVLSLAPGTYPSFDFENDGTAERPIAIRAQSAGTAIIDGEISLIGRSYVFLEGLTVRGRIRLNDTIGMVVRGCAIDTPGDGIAALGDGTVDSYICDNVITGPSTNWAGESLGVDGDNLGEGIQITGPGNVVCYNFVSGFRDCISTMEDDEAIDQFSIDIYNNDIELGMDDAIEADFTMGNVRVMRNRISNSFMGISGQPTLGGPLYIVRNALYNVILNVFKLNRGSVGDVALHNTLIKCGDGLSVAAGVPFSHAFFRNNLFIGGEGGGDYGGYDNGSGEVASLGDADDTCDFDFDGFGSIGTGSFEGRIGEARFSSLEELRANTTEANAVEVDLAIFAASVEFPSDGPFPARAAPDLRLSNGSAAVDRGVPLANVNDGFAGEAPDLGAYEAGSLLPHYGPRTAGVEPVCGNGTREGAEQCDDGNTENGDGCSADCALEARPGEDGGPRVDRDGGPGRDAGLDEDGGGCGCRTSGRNAGVPAIMIAFALALAARRKIARSR
jgi:cysteine-rich repeat protein